MPKSSDDHSSVSLPRIPVLITADQGNLYRHAGYRFSGETAAWAYKALDVTAALAPTL